jgi:hypothetical protein
MEEGDPCPRCKEGKLVASTFTENELDIPMSVALGTTLGMGILPMFENVEYVNYTCSKNCGYEEVEEA